MAYKSAREYLRQFSGLYDHLTAIRRRERAPSTTSKRELMQGTHFRAAPKNRHGAAQRKRHAFRLLIPPSRCERLLVRSLSVFGNNRRWARRDRAPRSQRRCHSDMG